MFSSDLLEDYFNCTGGVSLAILWESLGASKERRKELAEIMKKVIDDNPTNLEKQLRSILKLMESNKVAKLEALGLAFFAGVFAEQARIKHIISEL